MANEFPEATARCQHGLYLNDECDECVALAEAEDQLRAALHPQPEETKDGK